MEDSVNEAQLERERRLEMLFSQHYRALMAYAHRRFPRDLVDDIVAETFLTAWRRIDGVPANPRPWLLGVTRNVAATRLRSERRRLALLRRIPASSSSPNGELGVTDDLCALVIEALARLPERDREAITLIAWDDLTPAEAAKALGQSAASFRVRLHRVRKRLRQELARSPGGITAVVGLSADQVESRVS